jgi:L-amino acid N-acyltransferase YncA
MNEPDRDNWRRKETSMNTEFLEAREDDLDTMLDIYNHYIITTTVLFDYEEVTPEEFRNRVFLQDDRYKTFLVYTDNQFSGFCFIRPFRNKTAYDKTVEVGLYLKPESTGKGLGETIVKHMENAARTSGFGMMIASISGENTQSIKLFRKLGYKQCAHYKEVDVKFGRKQDIIDFQKVIE